MAQTMRQGATAESEQSHAPGIDKQQPEQHDLRVLMYQIIRHGHQYAALLEP